MEFSEALANFQKDFIWGRRKWVSLLSDTIKILGIHFSYSKKVAQTKKFTKAVTFCKRILFVWKQRWLTVAGMMELFKVLITSKLVYTATMKQL